MAYGRHAYGRTSDFTNHSKIWLVGVSIFRLLPMFFDVTMHKFYDTDYNDKTSE